MAPPRCAYAVRMGNGSLQPNAAPAGSGASASRPLIKKAWSKRLLTETPALRPRTARGRYSAGVAEAPITHEQVRGAARSHYGSMPESSRPEQRSIHTVTSSAGSWRTRWGSDARCFVRPAVSTSGARPSRRLHPSRRLSDLRGLRQRRVNSRHHQRTERGGDPELHGESVVGSSRRSITSGSACSCSSRWARSTRCACRKELEALRSRRSPAEATVARLNGSGSARRHARGAPGTGDRRGVRKSPMRRLPQAISAAPTRTGCAGTDNAAVRYDAVAHRGTAHRTRHPLPPRTPGRRPVRTPPRDP